MIAAIDFDVVAHLGNVRNVDLSQKVISILSYMESFRLDLIPYLS